MTREHPIESGMDNIEGLRWDPAVRSGGQRWRNGEETPKERLCLHYRSARLVLRNQKAVPFQAVLLHPGKSLSCWLPFSFFSSSHQGVLLKHQHYLLLLLTLPSNDYLAPPEVELFLQTEWCEVGWGKPTMVETPLSPGNLAVAPSPGLTPEQGHAFSYFRMIFFDPPSAEICQCVFPGDLANKLTGSMVFIDSPNGVLRRLQNWTHKQTIKILPPTSVWTLPFPKWPTSTDAAWVASQYFFKWFFQNRGVPSVGVLFFSLAVRDQLPGYFGETRADHMGEMIPKANHLPQDLSLHESWGALGFCYKVCNSL